MTVYDEVSLGQIALIKGGKRLPLGCDFSKKVTPHPYIRARDIGGSFVTVEEAVYLTVDLAKRLSRYRVCAGDICITIVGANVGETSVVPASLNGANLTENAVRVVSRGQVHQAFLAYAVSTADAREQMRVLAGGAAQPKLGLYKVESVRVPLPPVGNQRKIAAILSAYDDLIANNARRIRILEEMAQAIYREWFVDFRFPGHENVRLVESALGPIPEGWEVRRLDVLCSLVMGQSPKSDYYNLAGDGTAFHQGVSDFGGMFPSDRVYCSVDHGRAAEVGDILCSVRAPVGRLNIATSRILLGRGLCGIRHAQGHEEFLFWQLREVFREEDSMGTGAIFNAVTKSDLCGLRLLSPPTSILEAFQRIARPMAHLMLALWRSISSLRRTRDLVLPKLVSGEVDVSGLDIATDAAARPEE